MYFDYLTLIDSIKGMDYPTLWRILLLSFFRFGPIVAIAPFLGAKIIPNTARMALILSLAVVFLPNIIYYSGEQKITEAAFLIFAIKELFIGFILGYLSALPFYIAQSAGVYIDYMRGSSSLVAQNILLQAQSSPIGTIFNYYLILAFYTLNGHILFFDTILTSFEVFPVNAYINLAFFDFSNYFWQTILTTPEYVFNLSLQLAAPAILAVLMAEAFLGIANRLAPQVQIAFLGMSLKSLLGLAVMWAAWNVIVKEMGVSAIEWVRTINKILMNTSFTQ